MKAAVLHPHQDKAVNKMFNGCVLVGGTGVGKGITAMSYFVTKVCGGKHGDPYSMTSPRDLYVITTAKKRDDLDWYRESVRFGIGPDRENSIGNIKLTVDSWNSLSKYENVEDAFFIFDEQRIVGDGAWTKSFLEIASKNQWIMLSATPGDVWLDYVPLFLAHGFYPNRTAFKREHVIYNHHAKYPKVDRYVSTGKLVKFRNKILVPMPYAKHTVPVPKSVLVQYDEELFDRVVKKRWNVYEDRPIKRIPELFSVMRRVVNSDSSRRRAIWELMQKHPRLIVFYSFDYELEILRTLHGGGIPMAEWNGHKHEQIPDTDEWVYLVQYSAGAEGWECTTTDAMAFYSQTYSYRNYHQAHGRIDRLNTPYVTLFYYDLISKAPIDNAIRKALKSKKNFNEASFKITL